MAEAIDTLTDQEKFHSVVDLLVCPYCGDKMSREQYSKTTILYRHAGGYRGWCYDTNMYFGNFYTREGKPNFLGEGYPCP